MRNTHLLDSRPFYGMRWVAWWPTGDGDRVRLTVNLVRNRRIKWRKVVIGTHPFPLEVMGLQMDPGLRRTTTVLLRFLNAVHDARRLPLSSVT